MAQIIVISFILAPVVFHAEGIYVSTWRNSQTMKIFTAALYNIWGSPFLPVDLSQLNNFDGGEWLISITNFLNLDIFGGAQPIIVRHPIPSVIRYDKAFDAPKILGWTFGSTGTSSTALNSTWQVQQVSSQSCIDRVGCAALELAKLTLQSRLWNRQLRVDLFLPYLH